MDQPIQINPIDDTPAPDDAQDTASVSSGSLIKNATGVVIGLVIGIGGGAIYATPAEQISIGDTIGRAPEEVPVTISTPTTSVITYTVNDLNESEQQIKDKIDYYNKVKNIYQIYVDQNSYPNGLDADSVAYQLDTINQNIISLQSSLDSYKSIETKVSDAVK